MSSNIAPVADDQRQHLVNSEITAKQVRLIGADGQTVGILALEDALSAATEASLDLVLVGESSDPPVCKLMDYGKYKYEQHKKKSESKKKQKSVSIKEVQLRPSIGENDLLIKCKLIKRLIEEGDRVKVVLRFKGRELNRQDPGLEVINRVINFCQEFAKIENAPKMEGSTMLMILTGK